MSKELIQVNTKLTANTIRRETYNGREHIVVPSYTLPFNIVMNREYYPEAEIIANYQSLEGTLAPLGHPTVDGKFVSAFSPEGLNTGFVERGTETLNYAAIVFMWKNGWILKQPAIQNKAANY